MMFEDAQFMAALHSISPELTCQCDDVHTCQQCHEAYEEGKRIRLQKLQDAMDKSTKRAQDP
jgi:hypothetical protein